MIQFCKMCSESAFEDVLSPGQDFAKNLSPSK